jgi:hypothetical protein
LTNSLSHKQMANYLLTTICLVSLALIGAQAKKEKSYFESNTKYYNNCFFHFIAKKWLTNANVVTGIYGNNRWSSECIDAANASKLFMYFLLIKKNFF